MENRETMSLRRPAVLTVPVSDAEKLLAEASAPAALLYIYLLKNGGVFEETSAASDLRMTPEEVSAAGKILVRLGILSGGGQAEAPLPSAPELAEVNAEDIVRRTRDSADWAALLDDTQSVYGRKLSTAEVKTLFGIYDQIGLPAEVIMLLVHYCAEQTEKRLGPNRKPGFRALEKEAFHWVDREILTYERAEEWLAEEEKRKSRVGEVMQALELYGREPTATERRYIEQWLDEGFSADALAEARERTVTNTGSLKWKYMDGIVRSWHSKGLHTLAEIRAGDKKPARGAASEPEQGPTASELERMKKLREKVRLSGK